MTFWIISAALSAAVAILLVLALMRGRAGEDHPAAYDLRVYRDQMREVERDLARGVIGPEDAERIRAEVARRILAADAQLRETTDGLRQPRGPAIAAAVVSAAVVIGGGLWTYSRIGAPGYGDLGLQTRIAAAQEMRETRPSQATAESQVPPFVPPNQPGADYLALMERLRAAVAERPGDLQGHVLLARNEAALGNFRAAYQAQERILSIKGAEATAQDYVDYADLLVLAAGGYVSPEAEAALNAALTRDPTNGAARYYVGLLESQTARPDIAFRIWDAQLRQGPPDAPWIAPIRAQIEEVAVRAGVDYALPPERSAGSDGLSGPSAADIAAAGQMTPGERMEMIRGMVAGLSERLASQGGSAQEWARLITAYGVLGETGNARAIWTEAQQVFGSDPGAMDILRNAAEQAGIE